MFPGTLSTIFHSPRNRSSYLEQLELPGDIWNNRFIAEIRTRYPGLPIRKSDASGVVARKLYNNLEELRKERLYPVYLDASYSIGWNKSSLRFILDTISKGRDSPLCIAQESKVCPVIAYLTRHSRFCLVKNCPIGYHE